MKKPAGISLSGFLPSQVALGDRATNSAAVLTQPWLSFELYLSCGLRQGFSDLCEFGFLQLFLAKLSMSLECLSSILHRHVFPLSGSEILNPSCSKPVHSNNIVDWHSPSASLVVRMFRHFGVELIIPRPIKFSTIDGDFIRIAFNQNPVSVE